MPKEVSAKALRDQMLASGLKLEWVATRAGVSYSRASEVLNGRRISPKTLQKLSRVIQRAAAALQHVS